MPLLTVRQAAQHVGITRQTMFRHIKQGKVSATVAHDGELRVDTAELLRVYGALQSPGESPSVASSGKRQTQATAETAAHQVEIERMQDQLALAYERLDLAKERIEELRQRAQELVIERDRFLVIVERQSRLLSPPKAKKGKR